MTATTHYRAPESFDNVFNRTVRWLAAHGVNLAGAQNLTVAGRRTGNLQTVPVNVLRFDGGEYLVSPRGNTQWARNVRVAETVELRRGRRRSVVTLTEVDTDRRPPIIGEYLRKWGWEVGRFLPEGLDAKPSDADLEIHAGSIPVFEIRSAE